MEAWTWRIGRNLREARFRRWLELADVAADLGVPEGHLRALERERFDLLPGDEDVKRTLRAYAEYLGLDVELYLDEYDSRLASGKGTTPSARLRTAFRLVMALAILGLIGAGGFVVAGLGGRESKGEARSTPAVADATSSGGRSSVTQPPEQALKTTTSEGVAATPKARIVLVAARGDCWLSVRGGSQTGTLLYQGALAQGESLKVAAERLWIRFGAASHIDLILNGKAIKHFATGTVDAVVTARGLHIGPSIGAA